MIFREWKKEDNGDVAEIEIACFKSPWSKKMLDETLEISNFLGFVAESEGKVIGYVGSVSNDWEAEILNVAVTEKYRRQKIAKTLLEMILDTFLKQKKEKCFLEVRASNLNAKALYKKLGFSEIGVRKNYYENTEDAIIMAKCFEV